MRKAVSKLILSCAFAFLLLGACATPGFADEPSASVPATTSLRISAPTVCAARASVTVVMTLEDTSGAPIPGQTVKLTRITSTTETLLSSGVTDANGRFSARVSTRSRIVMRARYSGSSAYRPSLSRSIALKPRAIVSKPWTHDWFAYPEQWLPARGSLWPAHPSTNAGTVILCERLESGKWVLRRAYKATIITSHGVSRYVGKFRLSTTGTWRVRIRHADNSHARTYSSGRAIKVTRWRDRYVGHKLGGFRTKRKLVAITIDDGPNKRTPEICTILERYGARGTFFFVDMLLKQNGYMRQARGAYLRGHEIANHTATHSPLTGSYAHSLREATLARDRITKAIGFTPIWIRAMGGGIDSTGMRAVVNTHQLYTNWSIDSYDSHARYTAPDTLYHNVVDHVHPGDVILIHQTHPESVVALPHILRTLKARGYRMVTVSELASQSNHR